MEFYGILRNFKEFEGIVRNVKELFQEFSGFLKTLKTF